MSKKDSDIDKALEYMEKYHPGPHDLKTSADFCGMSHQALRETYDKALKKVQWRLLDELKEWNGEE